MTFIKHKKDQIVEDRQMINYKTRKRFYMGCKSESLPKGKNI